MSDEHTSDHFWKTCIKQVVRKVSSSYEITDTDYEILSELFEMAGGSWEALAEGDTDHWDVLRRACKVYLKRKLKKDEGNGKQ